MLHAQRAVPALAQHRRSAAHDFVPARVRPGRERALASPLEPGHDAIVFEFDVKVNPSACIDRDPAARVLIVTGVGNVFCPGGIRRMAAQGKLMEPREATLHEELYPHEAGLGIAAGCDVRLAVRGAKLGWVFTRRGIVPDDGSIYLMPSASSARSSSLPN
jgi:hypothetical protein